MNVVADADRPETVAELLQAEMSRDPERLFCTWADGRITVGQFHDLIARTSNALHDLGLTSGDRVATLLGNGPMILQVMFAALRTGFVWVPVNIHLRGVGLAHVISDCAPSMLIVDTELVPLAYLPEDLLGTCIVISVSGPTGSDALDQRVARAPSSFAGLPRATADDLIAISYTSGTTGPAKGVMLTNRMFVTCGRATEYAIEPLPGDVLYVWEPLYHVGGYQMAIVALQAPARLVIADRFSARSFFADIAAHHVTHVHYLGGMLQILLKGEIPQNHGIRVLWGGGCPGGLWAQVQSRLGLTPVEVYGMTEASSITTVNRGGPPGSVGRPLPWYEVTILAEDGAAVAQAGAIGEIVIRDRDSGRLTTGYWRQPNATRALLPGDGKLHTGDLGWMDPHGYLYFTGRRNDSVRNNGENVSAWEVENAIAAHPDVVECAMIGVDSDHGDQDIKVFVQLRPGAKLRPQELSEWCATRLALFQRPRYIAMVRELPKTATLRVRKELLRQLDDGAWDRLGAS